MEEPTAKQVLAIKKALGLAPTNADNLIAKFQLWFGRKELHRIFDTANFDYEVVGDYIYVYERKQQC